MKSLSEHYGSPGRLAEYKRQFRRAFRRLDDDPSIFAIELETLARRALADIDSSIQLQMVRDRFIDGQSKCALRRHLDSFGPDTPMRDIVDSCRVWESHNEAAVRRQDGSDRKSPQAVYQVTEVTRCVDRIGDIGRGHKTVVADADGAASEGGPYFFGPRAAHSALVGCNTATPASDTGAV